MECLQKSGFKIDSQKIMQALVKVRNIKKLLENAGVTDALKESELIVSFCLNKDRIIIYKDNPEILPHVEKKIDSIVLRRIQREPLQYIIGFTEFYGFKIKTVQGVLIPRPETELLVEESIKIIKNINNDEIKVLDLCTGTGCIAIAIAKNFPEISIYATDISSEAIQCARENAEINGVNNIIFIKGNLFDPLIDSIFFDVIVSNPPYIKTSEINNLQLEISKWEPIEALDGGKDGLDYYRKILQNAKNYLKPDGFIIFEMGEGQAEQITKIAEEKYYSIFSIKRDYSGIERIAIINLNKY